MQTAAAPLIVTSDRLRSPHAFSTRVGGVSQGIFASLNLGNPGDLPPHISRDPLANLARNFELIIEAMGCRGRRLQQVYQVHGPVVKVFRAGDPDRNMTPEGERDFKADAMVTDDPQRLLAVRVADCTPVLMESDDGSIVGAVHAGWRGVVGGVVNGAINAMRELGARAIRAAVGPCISGAHFQVGPEVAAEFVRVFGDRAPVVTDPAAPGKSLVDLKAAIAMQLRAGGVDEFSVSEHCTYRDRELFFSHRRDKGVTGRTGALIAVHTGAPS